MSTTTHWVKESIDAPKRKRAGLVCVTCHERKIKCDLQAKDGRGVKGCSRCIANRQECRVRASKRGNHHARAGNRSKSLAPVEARSPDLEERQLQSQAQSGGELEDVLQTPPRSIVAAEVISDDYSQQRPIRPEEDESSFGQRHHYLNHPLAMDDIEPSAQRPSEARAVSSTEHSWSVSSPHSRRNKNSEVYLGESGFLTVYSQEHRDYTTDPGTGSNGDPSTLDLPSPDLVHIFTETYFTSCYAFCPALDRHSIVNDLARSPLLVNALALAASHIQPPIIPSTKPATLYARAKHMFYNDEESDPITSLQAITLFYWWSPRPSSRMQKDGAWWWSSAGIRQAQQMGFHRERKPDQSVGSSIDLGIRRRIWWTFFARERLTAICQSRPCLIDPEDCTIPEPSLADFPDPTDPKAEVFIYWVQLCAIIGKVAKYRSRSTDVASLTFPVHLAEELIAWVQLLPQRLKLPIESNYTANFDRDVHQLHLPYLAVIIILHLSPSSQPLPRAYAGAVIAASCVARIFKDYLSRGSIRFLMPISGWICGIATLALLRACRIGRLTQQAEEDIKVLAIALTELRLSYPVADMFLQGFERLRTTERASVGLENDEEDFLVNSNEPIACTSNGVDWVRYFPYLTAQTSKLAGALLAEHDNASFLDEAWLGSSLPLQFQELFGPYGSFPDYVPIV